MAGNFKGTVPFPVGVLNSQGDDDVFIYKIDPTGTYLWAQSAGGPGKDKAYSISVDNTFNLFVVGSFEGTADFDGQTVTSAGGEDVFMAAYDGSGSLNLVSASGGPQFDRAYGLHKEFGHAYVCGVFSETSLFGSLSLNSAGYNDAFIYKFEDPVGIAEFTADDVNLFPNPFIHSFFVEIEDRQPCDTLIEIMDITGRLVYSTTLTGEDTINPGDIPDGIYEARIINGSSFTSKKLIRSSSN